MLVFVIFVLLIGLILLGLPVFISLGVTAVITFLSLGKGLILLALPLKMFTATTSFPLLAIPFFILAGNLMNTGGITTRLFRFARACVGHIWGGLGQVNVVASMIFSGMSGAAVADAAGLGQMELKAMADQGYDKKFSAAITAASSTIGPVIPPSIPFVIYASLTEVSVRRLFLAGCVPGVLMGLAMMVAVFVISKKRNYPREERASFKEVAESGLYSIIPMGTIFIILGGIFFGFFTPTEASVVATLYALIVGMAVYKEIKLKDLPRIVWDALKHTIRVMIIIAAAGFFKYLMLHQKIPHQVITAMTSISTNPAIIMSIIIFILLLLGCFLEGIAVLLITIPIFLPIITSPDIGMSVIQFGVIMTLASMIGLLTPPVGMCLYAVSGISGVSVGKLSRELWPYLLGIFIVLVLITIFPAISLWLPNLVMGAAIGG